MSIVDRYLTEFDLPAPLAPLADLARNLWWTWDAEARDLMASLDPDRWEEVRHNPVALLAGLDGARSDALAADTELATRIAAIHGRFRDALAGDPAAGFDGRTVAYFCAEFGIHESLPIYSGGLGILAGDHLKSASDLGLPLTGVGLAYRYGYFHQRIDGDGRQEEIYHLNEFGLQPTALQCGADGRPLLVPVPLPGREIRCAVWKLMVGRVPLFLLDTDVDGNSDEDRMITGHLYGGDEDTRIRQEMVLGVGGLRALAALGVTPDVCHLNEGHSAFLILEQAAIVARRRDVGSADAVAAVAERNTFTTHTPVAAGNDTFAMAHARPYLEAFAADTPLDVEALAALGIDRPGDPHARFGMTVLALRGSRLANGVSELHGRVARAMWRHLWPQRDEDDTPIGHVTNGVHMPSWIAPELDLLYRERLGQDGLDVPDETLWRLHERLRRRLVDEARARVAAQRVRYGATPAAIAAAATLLDPEALTIGFARRFAPYKRATLLLHERERLAALLTDPDRPVQLLLAGKAHPQNERGKRLMQEIWDVAHDPIFGGRIVLLEGYNITLARALVQGVDVWLNTPRRPLEASGTSGMKAAANGALNLSVSDGWWCEGYDGDNGWSFGDDTEEDGAGGAGRRRRRGALRAAGAVGGPHLLRPRHPRRAPLRWTAMMKAAVHRRGDPGLQLRPDGRRLRDRLLPALRGGSRHAAAGRTGLSPDPSRAQGDASPSPSPGTMRRSSST